VSAAGWRLPDLLARGDPLERQALALEAEFGRYHFGTCHTWDGRSLTAVRKPGEDGPGVCVVITPDVEEMRAALRGEPGPGG